jgi:16S rRNA (cytosine967-C5)-methyltransferase
MSLTGSQQQTFLRLLSELRPHWRREAGLPARIQTLLSGNRAFGSRDRRLYRELIYTTLRYLPWIEPLLDPEAEKAAAVTAWLAADTPATQAFRAAATTGWPPCPSRLAEKAALLGDRIAPGHTFGLPLPDWFRAHCPEAFGPAEADALLARAPLWVRLQRGDAHQLSATFTAAGWTWQRSEVLPSAFRLPAEAEVAKSEAYRDGEIEIQDLGSQLILASPGLETGASWLDACAGAGGKTLQLAQLLGPAGHVDAHDIRSDALAELRLRAQRAGLKNVSTLSAPPDRNYDGVLVDAPCSGTGTWRRSPHLKWTTSPAQIEAFAARQRALLQDFSRRVRPGGRLVYATCSLSRRENAEVVVAFLAANPDFSPAPFASTFGFTSQNGGFTIFPSRHDTDGFFVASLRRAENH